MRERRIIVCAGAGGVGKTTTSAALALAAAERGRRVGVLTIDPARRLAGALGLAELGHEPRRVALPGDGAGGERAGTGELWAMMLDAKRTFDELVERHAPDGATRDRILANPIYRELSSAVAGSQEYMAMEKLWELHEEGGYDLLVLDTPPTRNALDFLDAPERLARFVDSNALRMFLAPSRGGLRLFGRGAGLALTLLERVVGGEILRDVSEFFSAFGEMNQGFRERAVRVRELFGRPETTFVIVASPARDAIDEALFFRRRLDESGLAFGAAVVNRVSPELPDPTPLVEAEIRGLVGEGLGRRVSRNLAEGRALHGRDRESVTRLAAEVGEAPLVLVPQLAGDVHDLRGLADMGAHLMGAAEPLGSAEPLGAAASSPSGQTGAE